MNWCMIYHKKHPAYNITIGNIIFAFSACSFDSNLTFPETLTPFVNKMPWFTLLVEKPNKEEAPSRYAIMRRYVLRPEIFEILDKLPAGRGNE